MRARRTLLVQGVRWRLGASLLTLLTAATAVGAATLAPLYLRTAGDSMVRAQVAAAPVDRVGITLVGRPGVQATPAQIAAAETTVSSDASRWVGGPITTDSTGVTVSGANRSFVISQLLARTGICDHLVMVAGTCQLGGHDALVSTRSAAELGLRVGQVIRPYAGERGSGGLVSLRVAGVYAPPDAGAPYWWGNGTGYFAYGQTGGPADNTPLIDALVTSPATALDVPPAANPEVTGQLPLRAAQVDLGNETRLMRALSRARLAVASTDQVQLATQLDAILGGVAGQRHALATVVVVAAIQLALLAIWVLCSLLLRTADARQSEMRVARLRGFPTSSLLAVTAAEPVVLCVAGGAVGVLLAWLAVVVARGQVLVPSASIQPDGWLLASLLLVALGIAAAVGAASLRLFRSSAGTGPASATRAGLRRDRWAVMAEVVLVAVSVVAIVELAAGGRTTSGSDPVGSAAPGLVGLGVSVVAIELVLLTCRWWMSATADRPRVAAFLAVRNIVRRAVVLRQGRVVILALSLACFAASAWSVARTNRLSEARFGVGATQVATVVPSPGVSLQAAVRHVDPSGRFAMAAVEVATPSSTLLAVDASRLDTAMYWPDGVLSTSPRRLPGLLAPRTAPEISVPAAGMAVRASASGPMTAGAAGDLHLAMWVFGPQGGTDVVDLGVLRPGPATYRASLGGDCPTGCRLAGLGVVPAAGGMVPAGGVVTLTIDRVGSLAAAAVPASQWQSLTGGVTVSPAAGGGLQVAVPAQSLAAFAGGVSTQAAPLFGPADHPVDLPAVVTAEEEQLNSATLPGADVPSEGLDGTSINLSVAATASALPGLGDNGAVVDLALLQRLQIQPASPYDTDQVWLGPAAPKDVTVLLSGAGLRVASVARSSSAAAALDGSGPALADDFLLIAAGAAVLLAAASTLGALGATSRERATELAALEVAGVRRRALVLSLAIEAVVLVAVGLFGTVSGVVAAGLAMPSLPELAGPATAPLRYGIPVAPVVVVTAAVAVVVAVASSAVHALLLGRMSPWLLRTAPNGSAA